tara:strand:+ start:1233 stop:1913 length:681 start_codon:yes stop_codon:yes gene_type:complete
MASSQQFINNISKKKKMSKSLLKKSVSRKESSLDVISEKSIQAQNKEHTLVHYIDVLSPDPELKIDSANDSRHHFDSGLWEASVILSDLEDASLKKKKSVPVKFKHGQDEAPVNVEIKDIYVIQNVVDDLHKTSPTIFGQTNHFNFFEVTESLKWKSNFVFSLPSPSNLIYAYPLVSYKHGTKDKSSKLIIDNAFPSKMDTIVRHLKSSKSKKNRVKQSNKKTKKN